MKDLKKFIATNIRELLNENIDIETVWKNKGTFFFNNNQFKAKNGHIIEIKYNIVDNTLYIVANNNNKLIAKNEMEEDSQGYLRTIGMLKVAGDFRRNGVATAMYDYLDNEGYKIKPTNKIGIDGGLSDDATEFWKTNIE